MDVNKYKEYIKGTINTYNREDITNLYISFKSKHNIIKSTNQIGLFDEEEVKDGNDKKDIVLKCIDKYDDAINVYERNLFEKGYKYSVYYMTDNIDNFIENSNKISNYEEGNIIDIFDEEKIVKLDSNEKNTFLINKTFTRYDEENGNEINLHYPMLIVYHKQFNMIEIRFGALKNDVLGEKRNADFFVAIIAYIKEKIKMIFQCNLYNYNLRSLIAILKDEKSENKINGETKRHPNGGKTTIRASEDNYSLPIIDDLKYIIREKLKNELKNNDVIRQELEEFINQYDSTTECENIEVTFDANNKILAKRYKVQFKYNYFGRSETLVCFMYNNSIKGNERMNNVAKFIGENIRQI